MTTALSSIVTGVALMVYAYHTNTIDFANDLLLWIVGLATTSFGIAKLVNRIL